MTTATQMSHYIQLLISNNFDKGSAEYDAFVQEVEDQGF